ncbi:TB2/DP1, HVA22 family-domain-containing protein [Mycena maculata]|uniref:Protein YOP1 n=1 Tax=Mycena maculata TaxID=230809 RepID=A0AAD7NWH0_9AGAR|nr:TB2/DP1, HVA22 family-domain-containing protein [Mycena maculata]
MLFYLTSRIVGSVAAFLYPGYASYKTLSQRPASEEDLERWLMYWSVLGCIVSVEYVAEWLIRWIPFYYAMKTLLLLYLALPQTRGSTYIYINHLQPFFRTHETQIDSTLSQLRVYIYTFLQKQVKLLWEHIGATVGQQQAPDAAYPDPAAPPQPNGLGGVVGSLWRTYGPGILANGAAMLRPAAPQQRGPINMNSSAGINPSSMFYPGAAATTESILERRRRLEAELAALPAVVPSSLSALSLPTTPPSPSTTFSRNSSGADLVNRGARQRTDSVGKFEEVEVPSDGEGYDVRDEQQGRPAAAARGSWFGWAGGSGSGGYDRVKND